MRRFVIVSHTVPTDGAWRLDDLAGGAGRVDVVCRAITSALFTSHGIRHDTDVVAVFVAAVAAGGIPVAVRIRGAAVQRLNPDERSTAARLRNALRAAHPDEWWEEVESGIDVAPFGLSQILGESAAPTVLLDRDGADVMERPLPADAAWVLSDHQPFTDDEVALLAQRAQTLSLGPAWYHGHHVIGVVQFLLDRQEDFGMPRLPETDAVALARHRQPDQHHSSPGSDSARP